MDKEGSGRPGSTVGPHSGGAWDMAKQRVVEYRWSKEMGWREVGTWYVRKRREERRREGWEGREWKERLRQELGRREQ